MSAAAFISAPLVHIPALTSLLLAHLPRRLILQPSVRCFLCVFFAREEVISRNSALQQQPFEGGAGKTSYANGVRRLAHHRETEVWCVHMHVHYSCVEMLKKTKTLPGFFFKVDTSIPLHQLSLSWSPLDSNPIPPSSLLLWLVWWAINQVLVYLAVFPQLFGKALIVYSGTVNGKQPCCKFSPSSGKKNEMSSLRNTLADGEQLSRGVSRSKLCSRMQGGKIKEKQRNFQVGKPFVTGSPITVNFIECSTFFHVFFIFFLGEGFFAGQQRSSLENQAKHAVTSLRPLSCKFIFNVFIQLLTN